MQTINQQAPSGLVHRGRYLSVDCRHADAELWSERCRAFAEAWLAKNVDRVLVDATDCDPEGHRALRDALTTLVLAGIPKGLRLALVTNVPQVHAAFATLERDLVVLDMRAKLFGDEAQALEWLLELRPARRREEGVTGAA